MKPHLFLLPILTALISLPLAASTHEGEMEAGEAPESAMEAEAEGLALPTMGDCTPPQQVPEIPDGRTAPLEELRAASAQVRQYVEAGNAYTACLDAFEASLDEDALTPEQKMAIIQAHNGMIDSMQAVAADFNAQGKAYRERDKK